jgi:hypothetical protein
VLVGLGADQVLPWLAGADGAAMLLGMLAVMLLRPSHYAHQHTAHADAPTSEPVDPAHYRYTPSI